MSSKNYGSFYVNIPVAAVENEDTILSLDYINNYNKVLVNPLTQKELSEDWSLVVPKPKFKINYYTNLDNIKVQKKHFLNNIFKINLARLPNELWSKLKLVYEDGIYSYSIAKNNRYIYIINPTPVDDEIRELKEIVTGYYPSEKKERILELLQVLHDNNTSGWVILRAKRVLGSDIQLL